MSVAATATADIKHRPGAEDLFGRSTTVALPTKAVRGGSISALTQALTFVLQTGSMMVIARLLTPKDFGLQGMVVAMTGFLTMFRDCGLSVASVQREVLTHEQTSTLFWVNLAVGIALSLLTAACAPFLVTFYSEPRLFWITIVTAGTFVINGLAVQHRALLYRSMRFVTLAKIDLAALLVSAIIGMAMAALGYGYWALVAMAVSNPTVTTAGVWLSVPWVPGRPTRGTGVRSMLQMGGTVTLNSLVVYVAYNTEKILLGRFWGAEALGLYGRAFQLANLPIQQLNSSISTVALPALSRIQGDAERLRRSFLKAYAALISLTIPIVVGCAVFSEEIVYVLLGPKWTEAAPVFRLLAPTILAFALVNPFGWFLQATGRVQRSLNIAFLIAPVTILGVVIGLRYGPAGVALGYSIAMVLLVPAIVGWAKHDTGMTNGDYWDAVRQPLIAGASAGAAAWIFKYVFGGSLATLPMLILGIALLFGVYAWILLIVMDQKAFYVGLVTHALDGSGIGARLSGSRWNMWKTMNTKREGEGGKPKVGEWVQIRSKEEILRTLDASGRLDGMPFMPEMLDFCGKTFPVHKRAHKTCDTVFPIRSRRVDRAVHLDTRCSGQAHGGCQAGCLLFWKEEWLKPAGNGVPLQAASQLEGGRGISEADLHARVHGADSTPERPVFTCQATQLPYATKDLAWWDVRQYIEDYSSGNVGLWQIVCGFVYSLYHQIKEAGLGVGRAMEWCYDTFHPLWRGTTDPWKSGTIPEGQPTPALTLNLQPGELVRVKPHEEILRTLTINRANRGMKWDAELVPFCGDTFRVSKRVTKIIDEKTGVMQNMKTPCIVLDSVVCGARYSECRLFCPREIFPYFREIWLERASDVSGNRSAST